VKPSHLSGIGWSWSFDIAHLQFELSQGIRDERPFLGEMRVKRRDRFHPRHRLLLEVIDQRFRLVEHEGYGERSCDIRGH